MTRFGRLPEILRLRSILTMRPSNITTMIAIDLVAGIGSFAAAFAPVTHHHFKGPGIGFGSLYFVMAISLWLLGRRLNEFSLLIFAMIEAGATGALATKAPTAQGAILASFGFLWITVYAASFFARRNLWIVLIEIAVACPIALGINGIAGWSGVSLLLIATTWTVGLTLERSANRLRYEAETDALTGLLNRRGFFKAAALERSVTERMGGAVALVLVDLDNFKLVNDTEGHAAGDQVLVAATGAWQEEIRAGDLLARFGGDEFLLLLPGHSELGVAEVLERCRLAHPIAWTAGMAFLEPGESLDDGIQRADDHLYSVKLQKQHPTPPNEPIPRNEVALN